MSDINLDTTGTSNNRCGTRLSCGRSIAGCGGMSQGFHNNGFETVKAVEYDPSAVEFNQPESARLPGDIRVA
jgi:hypothetical protein